jgi:hypothetical protein
MGEFHRSRQEHDGGALAKERVKMSTDQQSNMPGGEEDKIEPAAAVTEIDVPAPKRVGVRLSDLRREPTEEEKAKRAEELRRLGMIAKGQHPDTGRPLRPGDASGLPLGYAGTGLFARPRGGAV